MPRKKSHITSTDQFCGAGGNGQGVERSLKKIGQEGGPTIGMNHWKLATETYQRNFPDAQVDCADISASDPRRYPSTHILVTSPECTTHSPAGGNTHKYLKKQMELFNTGKIDPATERSRATMWDVVRFAEYHKYEIIVAENVVEAKTRWPLFDVWLLAMHNLGYDHECCYFNSQHFHPTPQSRDRMYVVFWKRGNKKPMLNLTPRAHCLRCSKDVDSVQTWKNPYKKFGKYKQQYVYCCPSCTSIVEPYYYAAMNVIDWSDVGTRIGDREKPLAPKTMRRIQYGIDKFQGQPIQFHVGYGSQARGVVRHITEPGFTNTTVATAAIAHAPFIIKLEHGFDVRSVSDKFKTQTCRQSDMLISNIRSSLDAFQTQTTAQASGITFLTEMHSNGKSREITAPFNTVTAGGVKSGIVTNATWNSFLSYYNNGSNVFSHVTDAGKTQATRDRASLITYETPKIEDCFYRMIKAEEVKLSMAFDKDYIVLG
ncbi:MAG: DNA cytosine methyltransferase, partial [Chitinophagaceae bacterium]|nr:DNA cytosine methyltransferase [Chitinophagaceae bacterium]